MRNVRVANRTWRRGESMRRRQSREEKHRQNSLRNEEVSSCHLHYWFSYTVKLQSNCIVLNGDGFCRDSLDLMI